MKDTRVVVMTTRRCKDAQYRIDKAFSRILELCGERGEEKEEEVMEKNESSNICTGFDRETRIGANN